MFRPILLLPLVVLLVDYTVAIHWSNKDIPKVNLTIEVAEGTSTHGSNRLLCYPLTWMSLATFYIGNFGAYIATVQSIPGEKWPLTSFNMIMALLFPTSGLIRGLNAIVRNFSSSFFARKVVAKILRIKRWRRDETSLEKACKAGALCIVVRNANWRPKSGQANIPMILSVLVETATTEQPPLTPDCSNVQAARFVANSTEINSTSYALKVLGEETPECSTVNSTPKGNSQRTSIIAFCKLTLTRGNPNNLSSNVAQRHSVRLVDLFRHIMGPEHCRPYLESYSRKLQASRGLFIFYSPP